MFNYGEISDNVKVQYSKWLFIIFLNIVLWHPGIMANGINELDNKIEKIAQQNHLSGLGILVIQGDSTIIKKVYGKADCLSGKPITYQSLFRVASISKTIVAIGIMKLVEQGKLNLNDKVADLIPDVNITNPYGKAHPVRVVHLLEHTSGLDYMGIKDWYNFTESPDIEVKRALMVNPDNKIVRWTPGTRVSYSNMGYSFLGYIIEKVSGQKFDAFLKYNVLLPLGMEHSSFKEEEINEEFMTKGYKSIKDSAVEQAHISRYHRPAMSLVSSLNDMENLMKFLLNRGSIDSVEFLKSSTIERMESQKSTLASRCGLNIGYGIGIKSHYVEKIKLFDHSGKVAPYWSYYCYSPSSNFAIVLMTNNASGGASLLFEMFDEVIGQLSNKTNLTSAPEISLSKDQLQSFTGTYIAKSNMPFYGGISFMLHSQRIYLKKDTLYCKPFRQEAFKLIPVKNNVFRTEDDRDGTIAICKDSNNNLVMTGAVRRHAPVKDGYLIMYSSFLYHIVFYGMLIAIIMLLSVIPVSIGWIFMKCIGRLKSSIALPGKLILVLSSLIPVMLIFLLSQVMKSPETLSVINIKSLLIYILSLAFPLIAVISCFFTFRNLIFQNNRLTKLYLIMLSLSNLFVSFYFVYWGYCGIAIWNY